MIPPPAVRKIIMALTGQALARCAREGVAFEDFYRAMQAEQRLSPGLGLPAFFERVFARLSADRN